MTIEEKEILAKERAEAERKKKEAPDPTRRILLRIEAQDICRVPDAALKVAMCDVYSGSLKLVLRDTQAGVKIDNWVETESIGSRWVEVKSTGARLPGLFDRPSGIDCVQVDGRNVFFTCDTARNKISIISEAGIELFVYEGEGPSCNQFRQPCSVSCVVVRQRRVVDMILWEREEKKRREAELEAALEEEAQKIAEEEAEKRQNQAKLKKMKTKKEEITVGLGKLKGHASPPKASPPTHTSDTGNISITTGAKLGTSDAKSPSHKSSNKFGSSAAAVLPSWYLGFADDEDLKTYLYTHKDAGKIGDFAVARRIDHPHIYDLYYLADASAKRAANSSALEFDERSKGRGSVGKMTLRRQMADAVRELEAGIVLQTITKTGGKDKVYKSIWDFVRNQKHLCMPIHEPRPYVLCAVADKGNFRVQLYRYFWAENEVYAPSFEYFQTIGGIKRFSIELKVPVNVSFSPTGELVVLDVGTHPYAKLYLLSQRAQLIKELDVPFEQHRKKKARKDAPAASQDFKSNASASGSSKREGSTLMEVWPYWRQAKEPRYDEQGLLIIDDSKTGNSGNAEDENPFRDSNIQRKLEASRKKEIENISHKHAKYMKGAEYLQKKAEEKQAAKVDTSNDGRKPTSASFSSEGALAVGFKNGGILLYRPYKTYSVGNFEILPLAAVDNVIAYSDYHSVVLLRNCCRFLHNHTKRLRARWGIYPMRRDRIDSVMYQFLRWAVNADDNRVYYGLNPSLQATPPIAAEKPASQVASAEKHMITHGSGAKQLAKATIKSPDVVSAMSQQASHPLVDSAEAKMNSSAPAAHAEKSSTSDNDTKTVPPSPVVFTDTSHCYPYCDVNGDLLCEAYIERRCTAPHCLLKHASLQPIGDPRIFPPVTTAGLELKHMLLACYNVFSPRFVWAKERYIEELFKFYSVNVDKVVRHELLDRHGVLKKRVLLREPGREIVPLLSLEMYLDIMHYLEEDFTGARKIRKHPLFHRTNRFSSNSTKGSRADDETSITSKPSLASMPSHAGTASVTSAAAGTTIADMEDDDDDLEEFKPYGPYDIDAAHQRIYVDVFEQYDMTQVKNGINVPFIPLRPGNKKFLVVPGMEQATRGVADTEVQRYTQTFEAQTSKATSMINRLFL